MVLFAKVSHSVQEEVPLLINLMFLPSVKSLTTFLRYVVALRVYVHLMILQVHQTAKVEPMVVVERIPEFPVDVTNHLHVNSHVTVLMGLVDSLVQTHHVVLP